MGVSVCVCVCFHLYIHVIVCVFVCVCLYLRDKSEKNVINPKSNKQKNIFTSVLNIKNTMNTTRQNFTIQFNSTIYFLLWVERTVIGQSKRGGMCSHIASSEFCRYNLICRFVINGGKRFSIN